MHVPTRGDTRCRYERTFVRAVCVYVCVCVCIFKCVRARWYTGMRGAPHIEIVYMTGVGEQRMWLRLVHDVCDRSMYVQSHICTGCTKNDLYMWIQQPRKTIYFKRKYLDVSGKLLVIFTLGALVRACMRVYVCVSRIVQLRRRSWRR